MNSADKHAREKAHRPDAVAEASCSDWISPRASLPGLHGRLVLGLTLTLVTRANYEKAPDAALSSSPAQTFSPATQIDGPRAINGEKRKERGGDKTVDGH